MCRAAGESWPDTGRINLNLGKVVFRTPADKNMDLIAELNHFNIRDIIQRGIKIIGQNG